MRILYFFIALIYFNNAFAYSVNCQKDVSGQKPFRVSIDASENSSENGWLVAKVINEYNQGSSFAVHQTSRKNMLQFQSLNGKSEFILNLGEYHSEGVYKNSDLGINTNTSFSKTMKMDCQVSGEISFVNYCLPSKDWDPEKGLLQAAADRNFDLLEATLECGIDPTIKDKKDCTPMLLVADGNCGTGDHSNFGFPSNNLKDLFGLLIDKGANVDDIDLKTGESPLLKVVRARDQDAAEFLLVLDADINLQDLMGTTALMRATENNDYWMVNSLVSLGAETKLKNKNGQTALDVAKLFNNKKIIPLLEEPQAILTVEGRSDGSCSLDKIEVTANKVSRIILKTTNSNMFKFEVSDLNIEIVANAKSQEFKNIFPKKQGEYEFTCGWHHGGGLPTHGKLIVR